MAKEIIVTLQHTLSPDEGQLLAQLLNQAALVLRPNGLLPARLISDCLSAGRTLQYYRVQPDEATVGTWLLRETAAAEARLPALTQALRLDDPRLWGEAFAQDVISAGVQIVLIDEADHLQERADETAFWPALAGSAAGRFDVIVVTRRAHRSEWRPLFGEGDAGMLASHVVAPASAAPESMLPRLDVFAFGRGRAFLEGEEIMFWEGLPPRSLFFYLIDRPLVARLELLNHFWPHIPQREAIKLLRIARRKMTERISIPLNRTVELTRSVNGFYLPNDSVTRHYDVFAFQSAIYMAEQQATLAEAAPYYRQAVALYRAPFLQQLDHPWADARREHLRTAVLQALSALTEEARQRGRLDECIHWAARAVYEGPDHADTYRELIALYRASGRHADAHAQLDRLARAISRQQAQQ